MQDCLFCKIIAGEIPGKFVYEDDGFVAFRDINPKANVHLLICPRDHSHSFQKTSPDVMPGLTRAIQKIASALKIEDNYSLQINNGAKSGQIVFHLHVHLFSSSTEAAELISKRIDE
ncbi:MAG: HIT domain-containing protein [candidate division Zixibacteria bacterium]|nr:HIT domain-containing protein [candidate division Zixibacteria bacterium]